MSDIQDKEFLKDMINLALETKDKKWFNQLTEELNKLEKEDDTKIDLFNPKSDYEGYYNDLFEYEYYICQTDCNSNSPLIIIGNTIYDKIIIEELYNKIDYFVELKTNKVYKKGDKIYQNDLQICCEEYSVFYLGYIKGQLDFREGIFEYCNSKDKKINLLEQHNALLQSDLNTVKEYNNILKSELGTLQNNYFINKKKKKFKWKFWKK
ncbi:IDEAL domain-containing protein [Clostridium botulinum]